VESLILGSADARSSLLVPASVGGTAAAWKILQGETCAVDGGSL
jgi:hypothetical protein